MTPPTAPPGGGRLTVDADQNGVITGAHGDVEAMTGWTVAELIGQTIEVVIPPKYRERHLSAFDSYTATGRKKAMGSWLPVECLHKDGSLVPIMLVITENAGLLQGIMEERDD